MKRNIRSCRWLRVGVGVVLGIAAVSGAVVAQNQKQSSPAVRLKTFDVVWKTINDKGFDPKFGGVDWAAVRTRYAPQLAEVKSDQELHELLDRMVQELKVSHHRVYDIPTLERLMARSVINTGLSMRDVAGEVVVTRVRQGSSAQKAGLRTGYVITRIDGVPATDARQTETTLAVEPGTHDLHYVDEQGTTRQTVVTHELPPADQLERTRLITAFRYSLFESARLDDGIGYIHFTNFIPPVKRRLQDAFQSMSDAPGIVLDLRGNTGGEAIGPDVAGLILDKPAQLAITRMRKGDDNYYKAKPQKKSYLGPVVILLDEESRSESEQLTAGLQELGRVIVIGTKSRGIVMDATLEELPTGALLLYAIGHPRTPKGIVLEGRGVTPDIEVPYSRSDLLNGRDSQLLAALDHFRRTRKVLTQALP